MTSLRGLIVLVVDDDEDVRDVLSEMLERAGAVVVAVASGRQALAQLDATPHPDALVAELLTPDGDGFWLLEQVRERGLTLPVLALAGHLDARSRPGLLGLGFADVVLKPVGPADLARAVALSLGRAAAEGRAGADEVMAARDERPESLRPLSTRPRRRRR